MIGLKAGWSKLMENDLSDWYEAYELGVQAGVRGDTNVPEYIKDCPRLFDIYQDGREEGRTRDHFYLKQREINFL